MAVLTPINELVEWDFTHAVVLAVRSSQFEKPLTVAQRRPDSRTRWLRVFADYPKDFQPGFEDMVLGPAVYDLMPDEQGLRKYWPHADFSIETLRKVLLDRLDETQDTALKDSDFYIIRKVETGEPIPEDVAQQRDEVRDTIKRLKAQVRKGDPADLVHVPREILAVPIVRKPPQHTPTEVGLVEVPMHVTEPEDEQDLIGQPGSRPSGVPVGDEPTVRDPQDYAPPDPRINGAPIDAEGNPIIGET